MENKENLIEKRMRWPVLWMPIDWACIIEQQLRARASLVAQLVKNLPAMRETRVRYLGWEDNLEKE